MSSGEDGLIGIPFPEHSSELLSRLNDQRRAGLLCDLTLTSRGARYPTHRSVMAAVSLYFRRLFGVDEEGGGGGGDSAFSVCQLDCVSPDALDALLDFAYTATLTIRASNMRDVLRAAQLLGIQCVEDACRDILGEKEETRGGDEEERRGGDEEKEEGGRRSPRRSSHHHHHHQGASYDKLGTEAATAAEGREPSAPPPRERGSRRKTDRTKTRRVASVTGGVEQDPSAAPQATAIDSSALQQQEGEEEEEGEGSKPVTAGESSGRGLGLGGVGRRRRQGEEGRKRKWKSHVPQQCPVCQKVIHDARNLPRHMGTHTERSCTYLNGLGLCLSVGNVEREDCVLQTSTTGPPRVQSSVPAQTPTSGPPRVQSSMPAQTPTSGPPHVQSSMPAQTPTTGPPHVQSSMPAQTPTTGPPHVQSSVPAQTPTTGPPHVQSSVPAQTPTTGPPHVQSSMPAQTPTTGPPHVQSSVPAQTPTTGPPHVQSSVPAQTPTTGPPHVQTSAPLHHSEHNGGGGGVGEGIGQNSIPSPHRTPSSSAALLMPPPPADAAATPPDHLLKHEEEEEEEEGGEGFRPASVLAERVRSGGAGGDGVGGRKRRFPSQMPQRCPVCQKVIHGAGKLPRHMRTHAERSCTYLNGLGLCLSVGNVEQEDSELGAPSTTSPAHASPPTAAQTQTPGASPTHTSAAASPAHLPLIGTDSEGLVHKLPANM